MIKKRWFRITLGVILGGFAGLSLTSSVLPMMVSAVVGIETFFVRWSLGEYAAHSTLVFAFGGWVVAKYGHPKIGPAVLGLLGLVSGVLLCYAGLGTESKLLVLCGVGGGGYGLIGGLLLGHVLAPPAEVDEAASDSEASSRVASH